MDNPNGKTNGGTFATNIPDWTAKKEDDPFSAADFATKNDVMAYVQNAFLTWHQPDHLMLSKLASVIDTLLLYIQERGMEISDGRAYIDITDIQPWAEARKAAAEIKPEDAA